MNHIEVVEERLKNTIEIGDALLSRGASSIKSTINRKVSELKKTIEELKTGKDTINESKITN